MSRYVGIGLVFSFELSAWSKRFSGPTDKQARRQYGAPLQGGADPRALEVAGDASTVHQE